LGSGLADTFLRDNKVIPPVLALLALLVFAWIVAGIFVGGPPDKQTSNYVASNQANPAQSQNPAGGSDTLAPGVENRNAESYAAYQSKDPFRQLFAPAASTTATSPATESTTGTGGTSAPGSSTAPAGGLSSSTGPSGSFGSSTAPAGGTASAGGSTPAGGSTSAGSFGGGTAPAGAGNRGAGGNGGLFNSGGDLPPP
jgi:hypothetical protein